MCNKMYQCITSIYKDFRTLNLYSHTIDDTHVHRSKALFAHRHPHRNQWQSIAPRLLTSKYCFNVHSNWVSTKSIQVLHEKKYLQYSNKATNERRKKNHVEHNKSENIIVNVSSNCFRLVPHISCIRRSRNEERKNKRMEQNKYIFISSVC